MILASELREVGRLVTIFAAHLIGDQRHITQVVPCREFRGGHPTSMDSISKTEGKLDDGDGAFGDLHRIQDQDTRSLGIAPVGDSDEKTVGFFSYNPEVRFKT